MDNTPFNQELLAQKQKQGHQALSVMERHLKNYQFFVGNQFTIADIALYAYTHVADEGGFDCQPTQKYVIGLAWYALSMVTLQCQPWYECMPLLPLIEHQ